MLFRSKVRLFYDNSEVDSLQGSTFKEVPSDDTTTINALLREGWKESTFRTSSRICQWSIDMYWNAMFPHVSEDADCANFRTPIEPNAQTDGERETSMTLDKLTDAIDELITYIRFYRNTRILTWEQTYASTVAVREIEYVSSADADYLKYRHEEGWSDVTECMCKPRLDWLRARVHRYADLWHVELDKKFKYAEDM